MKKIIFIVVSAMLSLYSSGQELTTIKTTNWNVLRKSGFYESHFSSVSNTPTNIDWFWGINISHTINASAAPSPYHYGAQILFPIKNIKTMAPEMYIRSMNKEGEGMWVKVIHSKGNHAIDGKLTAKEIEIKVVTGADFVFEPSYKLKPLSEIEAFVKENKHLPEIPSEKQMIEEGISVNELQIKLLQKIEELTLYVIDQQKQINSLQEQLQEK